MKLILLGLLVNFTTGGFTLPLRWAGVLQRIGLCYLAAWAAKRWLSTRGQAVLAVALLLGYWAVMTHVVGPEGFAPNLEPQTNLSAQVDRIVLSGHLYRWTKTWDPEGVLSTFPAIATALLGLLAGAWLRSRPRATRKAVGFVAGGLLLFVLGLLWGEAAPAWLRFPVNKNLWSPSFVLLTAGLGGGALRPHVVARGRPRACAAGRARSSRTGRTPSPSTWAPRCCPGALGTIAWASAGGRVLSLRSASTSCSFASWLPPMLAAFAFALANVRPLVGRRPLDGPPGDLPEGLTDVLVARPNRAPRDDSAYLG